MRASRFFDLIGLIGKAFAVLIFGGFAILILNWVIGSLFMQAQRVWPVDHLGVESQSALAGSCLDHGW
jgi:hypothetical protein